MLYIQAYERCIQFTNGAALDGLLKCLQVYNILCHGVAKGTLTLYRASIPPGM